MISKQELKNLTNLKGYKFDIHQRRKTEIKKIIKKFYKNTASILDVGCATGDIAVELSIDGYKLHGIEMSLERIAKAKQFAKKYNQDILFEQKKFETLKIKERFDIILMGEIIEHFQNPVEILIEAQKFLNKNGKILITTPNMPSLRNRIKFGILGTFPDNNPEHKYYFDRRRFGQIVKEAGFNLLYFKTKFSHIILTTEKMAKIEKVLFSWVSRVFRSSGDTIFAVISPL